MRAKALRAVYQDRGHVFAGVTADPEFSSQIARPHEVDERACVRLDFAPSL